jgi:hypothetical protein
MGNLKSTSVTRTLAALAVGATALASFGWFSARYSEWRLQQGPMQLQVEPLMQSMTTSCGEAAITMAYNYAHPNEPLSEQMVIDFATQQGYFTPGRPPYTGPDQMLSIARHYADQAVAGRVSSAGEGLALLMHRLERGDPVIIDVLTRLNDPDSEAHFVVVTGLSLDAGRADDVIVHFNDPLSGRRESATWAGEAGIWNAWLNNGDPGGAGWWMVIE